MKHVLITATAALLSFSLTVPAFADTENDGEIEEGFSLMEEGAKLLFRGIISEIDPAVEEFSDLAQELQPALEMLATEFGPAMAELFQTLDDIRYYEPPEVLPNGDIIIRRSPDAPEFNPKNDAPIDL